jgi:transposase
MGLAHSLSKREAIVQYRQEGISMTEISETLGISYSSVRDLCKRYSESQKTDAPLKSVLTPQYSKCGIKKEKYSVEVVDSVLLLKTEHTRWGAPRLLAELERQVQGKKLPSIRSVGRWFRKYNLSKPPRQAREPVIGRARAVHNIWEVDAKENLILLDGQEACYLTTVDEKSGALLASPVFPL